MIKINDTNPIKQPYGIKKRGSVSQSSGDDFLQMLSGTEETAGAAETQSTSAPAPVSLDGILALQEVSDDEVNRKKAMQNGKNMLDALEQLRHALLMGNVPVHVLRNLTRAVDAQSQTVMDPKLSAIMDDIKLRAAVEVAKLEMAEQEQA